MARSSSQIPEDGPINVEGLPDRSEKLSVVKQGPVRRITLWQEIFEDSMVDGSVTGHYFKDSGLLLINLHNGDSE